MKKPIDVLKFLTQYPKAIIKPTSGNHGNHLYFIEENANQYIVNYRGQTTTYTKLTFYDFLTSILHQKMLIQKYINCKRKSGEPYDIRLHLQKDGEGKWQNTLIYPKIGYKERIATNLGQGGNITLLDNFLYHEFGEQYLDIASYLKVFGLQFANHFDELYGNKLDELGIDVGLDEKQKIWLYEVNWRPGHLFLEADTAKNAVRYAKYLAKKEGQNETTATE